MTDFELSLIAQERTKRNSRLRDITGDCASCGIFPSAWRRGDQLTTEPPVQIIK